MRFIRFFLLSVFLLACNDGQPHAHTYYFWKTKLSLDKTEQKSLSEATAPYLYTRFFDVDKPGGKFQPLAVISKDKSFQTDKEIVPVVFLMNRVFVNISKDEINFLAASVFNLVQKKTKDFGFRPSAEIQIDCDWTAGTRDDYFKFLQRLKEISRKDITSTLRLHQVKDKGIMGIPPVKKVYLMCYSTSSPLEHSDKNSILDPVLAKNYLSQLQNYPIKNIDIALPVYTWGIITNHLGRRKLINALSSKDLEHPNLKRISENEAEVLKDGFYFGNYLNKGFRIKIETVTEAQRKDLLNFLSKKLDKFNIVYYQLDSKFIE